MNEVRFHKVLVANRGEIASRIIRAIRSAGMKAVAVYSEADRDLPYVREADESWALGSGTLMETYLHQEQIVEIAERSGASAIHPGYGFLAENSSFAALCKKRGIIFIGPEPEVIDLMGNKANARETAIRYGVPVIEGLTGSKNDILGHVADIQFPLLIKPAAGGGGKGMHVVRNAGELVDAIENATREANNYFGSDELYVERYIEQARHIEVQVIADHHGNAVHLYERECSLQRRYQKIIEEAPSPSLSSETRDKMTSSAVDLVRGIGYTNAGTIEFLMDEKENYYFIEMNTRIQVEHPVTEIVTGIDIVKEQLRIAAGEKLSFEQEQVKITGHAIEARLYAEDPANEFMPATGKIRKIHKGNVRVRMDEGYEEGNIISPFYDPLITKIISSGIDRKDAIRQLISGLRNFHLSGVRTNRDFLVTLLLSDHMNENRIHTRLIDQEIGQFLEMLEGFRERPDPQLILTIFVTAAVFHDYREDAKKNTWETIGYWRQKPDIQLQYGGTTHRIPFEINSGGKELEIRFDERKVNVRLLDHSDNFFKLMVNSQQYISWADVDGADIILEVEQFSFHAKRMDIPDERYSGNTAQSVSDEDIAEIFAPLNGKVVKINVRESDTVKAGDTLMVIESMKMENRIITPRDAEVSELFTGVGDLVEANELLMKLN